MTREEAISLIKLAQLMLINPTTNEPVSDLYEALDMAIQALSQEPISLNDINNALGASFRNGVRSAKVEQEPCDDAISRDAVMRLIENKPYDWSNLTERHNMLMKIRKLPSVTQKSGKWNEYYTSQKGNDVFNCKECGHTFVVTQGKDNMNYCPNCGAKMVEPQESETWNGIHGQITAPKGTFERIFNEADDDNDI